MLTSHVTRGCPFAKSAFLVRGKREPAPDNSNYSRIANICLRFIIDLATESKALTQIIEQLLKARANASGKRIVVGADENLIVSASVSFVPIRSLWFFKPDHRPTLGYGYQSTFTVRSVINLYSNSLLGSFNTKAQIFRPITDEAHLPATGKSVFL